MRPARVPHPCCERPGPRAGALRRPAPPAPGAPGPRGLRVGPLPPRRGRQHLVLQQQWRDPGAQVETLLRRVRAARRRLQARVRQRPLERMLLPLLAAVPPLQLRQRQPVAAHRNHRVHRHRPPLLPVPVAPEHPAHRLLRPPGGPVRLGERPLLPRRIQGLPLVLPQFHRRHPVQNRGLPARIGHAHGNHPSPAAGRNSPAPCRSTRWRPAAASAAALPARAPHPGPAAPAYPPAHPCRPPAAGRYPTPPHAHRGQPGLPFTVVAVLGVLAQLAPSSLPGPSPHTGTDPHRCAHACAPSGTSRAPCRNPSSAAWCIRCRSAPSRRLSGTARSPHARRATGSAPRAATAWRCPRRRRPRRAAPAAAAQRCATAPATLEADRGSQPQGQPEEPGQPRHHAEPGQARPVLVADAASQGGSAGGGQGPGGPPEKSRGTPAMQSADNPEDRLNHGSTKTFRMATAILTRESEGAIPVPCAAVRGAGAHSVRSAVRSRSGVVGSRLAAAVARRDEATGWSSEYRQEPGRAGP